MPVISHSIIILSQTLTTVLYRVSTQKKRIPGYQNPCLVKQVVLNVRRQLPPNLCHREQHTFYAGRICIINLLLGPDHSGQALWRPGLRRTYSLSPKRLWKSWVFDGHDDSCKLTNCDLQGDFQTSQPVNIAHDRKLNLSSWINLAKWRVTFFFCHLYVSL